MKRSGTEELGFRRASSPEHRLRQARWRTSGRFPHDEGSIPQCAVWGIWPTAFKACGQDRVVRMRSHERALVRRVGIAFDRRDEAGAQRCARCTGDQRLIDSLSIADPTTSEDGYFPSLL
jgi:hypothetical protein